jgi:hypothetical protein
MQLNNTRVLNQCKVRFYSHRVFGERERSKKVLVSFQSVIKKPDFDFHKQKITRGHFGLFSTPDSVTQEV